MDNDLFPSDTSHLAFYTILGRNALKLADSKIFEKYIWLLGFISDASHGSMSWHRIS